MNKEELKAKLDEVLELIKSEQYEEATRKNEELRDATKNDIKGLESLLKAHRETLVGTERFHRFIDEKSRRQTAGTADKNSVVDSLKAIDPSIKVDGPMTRVSELARKAAGNLRKPQANNTETG